MHRQKMRLLMTQQRHTEQKVLGQGGGLTQIASLFGSSLSACCVACLAQAT